MVLMPHHSYLSILPASHQVRVWDIRRFGALHILDHYATTPVRVRRQQQQQQQQQQHEQSLKRVSLNDPSPRLASLSRSLSAGVSGARRHTGTGELQSEEDAVEAAWASLALHNSKQGAALIGLVS